VKHEKYAERELEIAEKLHSRERRTWIHFYSSQCRLHRGELEQAEKELLDGIMVAEAIGEKRALALFRPTLAVVQVMQGRKDEALSPTDSRVSQLWLGPLYIKVLMALGKKDEAREKLTAYKALVDQCQSPRFYSEAQRLAQLF